MNYWQIAAGSQGRDYANEFLRFGMAFVGGNEQIATMARVAVGDRVILKKGMSQIVAVGEVVVRDGRHRGQDDKEWLYDFDGWELPAWCYVDWHVPANPITTAGLTRATIQNVNQQHLRDEADRLLQGLPANTGPFHEPAPTRSISDEELLDFLIEQGLRASAADELAVALRQIRLLSRYYTVHAWNKVGEHEARTFLVVPLLITLGWAEQQLKIELHSSAGRVDVACYSQPFADEHAQCVLLIETKSLRTGLDYAPQQARTYAAQFPKCEVVLVSNGYCYKAFKRESGSSFSQLPSAYLNLLSPRDRYPLDPEHVAGSLEVLRLLLPSSYR